MRNYINPEDPKYLNTGYIVGFRNRKQNHGFRHVLKGYRAQAELEGKLGSQILAKAHSSSRSFGDLKPAPFLSFSLPIYLCIYRSIDLSLCLCVYIYMHVTGIFRKSVYVYAHVYIQLYIHIYIYMVPPPKT